MRRGFGRRWGTRRFVSSFLCRVRPNLCWIGLLTLDVRHLAERMLFAGYAKQQHAKQNSNDTVAEEKSHNALAQLSASGLACKDESAVAVVAFVSNA